MERPYTNRRRKGSSSKSHPPRHLKGGALRLSGEKKTLQAIEREADRIEEEEET